MEETTAVAFTDPHPPCSAKKCWKLKELGHQENSPYPSPLHPRCLSFWKGIGLQPISGCEWADLWPESFSLHYGTLMKDEEGIRHNYSCSDLALSTHLISELGGMRNFNQIPDILLRVLLQLGHGSEPGVCLVSLDIFPCQCCFIRLSQITTG